VVLARRLALGLMAAGATATPLWAAPRQELLASPAPVALPVQSAAPASAGGAIALSLRRGSGSVELVIEGTGASPVLQQARSGNGWVGQLRTASPGSLRMGPQRFSLPEAGLQSVSLQGSGSDYQVQVVPMPGAPLGRPMVSADGRNLIITFATAPQVSEQSARLDLRTPGTVPQPSYALPLQPRAVAPPLGDMAVGSMVLRNRSFLNLNGPAVSMTMRNAPARDVLMALAQMGGYGFVYVDDEPSTGGATATAAASGAGATTPPQGRPVSIAFRGESYARALNSVLLAAGLQGKLEGNMILAGPSVLGKTFGAQLSKVYRLNQATAASAADYLASLGAKITKVTLITNTVSQGQSQANQVAGAPDAQQTQTQRITTTETYGASAGPLKGLTGTTDSRLQTITLVGDPQVVAVAENYLKQVDLRQRQVALSVKILDVTLRNDADIKNSFAFRYGNNFIVSEEGRLIGAFNDRLPPGSGQFDVMAGGAGSVKPVYVTKDDPSILRPPLDPAPANPSKAYSANNFYDLVRAQVQSESTKVLASPTLILSENPEPIQGGQAVAAGSSGGDNAVLNTASIGRPFANESFVTVGTQVITDYAVQAGQNGAPNTCQPKFGTAGLTFGAKISKIDDNGFVTFSLSPAVSAVADTPQQIQGCGNVSILRVRRLDTGEVRVRDGQTLILTGVIADEDRQAVMKWPILGDMPFVGQFFRSSSNARQKNELVILVTPRIINDLAGGTYGYGYQPVTPDSRRFMAAPSAGSAF
jgi:type IV pilus assembly protein PilQ